jgi:hypothetical protein
MAFAITANCRLLRIRVVLANRSIRVKIDGGRTSRFRLMEALDWMEADPQHATRKQPLNAGGRLGIAAFRFGVARLTPGSARSGRASLVEMMKPADFWNLNDPALIGRLDFSGFR